MKINKDQLLATKMLDKKGLNDINLMVSIMPNSKKVVCTDNFRLIEIKNIIEGEETTTKEDSYVVKRELIEKIKIKNNSMAELEQVELDDYLKIHSHSLLDGYFPQYTSIIPDELNKKHINKKINVKYLKSIIDCFHSAGVTDIDIKFFEESTSVVKIDGKTNKSEIMVLVAPIIQ